MAGTIAITALLGVAQMAGLFSRQLRLDRLASGAVSKNELALEYLKSKFAFRTGSTQRFWEPPSGDTNQVRITSTVAVSGVGAGFMPIRVNLKEQASGTCNPGRIILRTDANYFQTTGAAAATICDKDDYIRDDGDRASLQDWSTVNTASQEKQKAFIAVPDITKLTATEQEAYIQGNFGTGINSLLNKALSYVQVEFVSLSSGTLTVSFLEDGTMGQIDLPETAPSCTMTVTRDVTKAETCDALLTVDSGRVTNPPIIINSNSSLSPKTRWDGDVLVVEVPLSSETMTTIKVDNLEAGTSLTGNLKVEAKGSEQINNAHVLNTFGVCNWNGTSCFSWQLPAERANWSCTNYKTCQTDFTLAGDTATTVLFGSQLNMARSYYGFPALYKGSSTSYPLLTLRLNKSNSIHSRISITTFDDFSDVYTNRNFSVSYKGELPFWNTSTKRWEGEVFCAADENTNTFGYIPDGQTGSSGLLACRNSVATGPGGPAIITQKSADGWVKNTNYGEILINGNANWRRIAGNRHTGYRVCPASGCKNETWSGGCGDTSRGQPLCGNYSTYFTREIVQTWGLLPKPACNILRVQSAGGAPYVMPNSGGACGSTVSDLKNGKYQVLFKHQCGADWDLNFFITIDPNLYNYRIDGYGKGSCP